MWLEDDALEFDLTPDEMALLQRAANERNVAIESDRASFSKSDLVQLGVVREAFNREELRQHGVGVALVSSHDAIAQDAKHTLGVGSPHPSQVEKWQLPVDMLPFRPVIISFPPGSKMARRTQPIDTPADPGGALRVVLRGSLTCNAATFVQGEWFFVPNGFAYTLSSDEKVQTDVLYIYRFPTSESGGRFSYETNQR